jgi:hypothetical protein
VDALLRVRRQVDREVRLVERDRGAEQVVEQEDRHHAGSVAADARAPLDPVAH